MKRRIVSFFLIPFCVLWLLVSSNAETAGDTGRRIDTYLQRASKDACIPGMAVIIVDQDSLLLSGTYGNCDSIDTPFVIGSLSKSFTALCIMRLAEQGKVNLDEKLSTYLPDATDGDNITVRQLLNQTSGLGQYQTLSNFKITASHGKHQYANVNYGLLGEIVEAVSGKGYDKYVTESVFLPLGMRHSGASLEKGRENGLIAGYRNYFGFPIAGEANYPLKNSWGQVPAGYISSSAADMGKYLQMYLNRGENVVSAKSIDSVFYDNVPVNQGSSFYGMGWSLSNEYRQPLLAHSGLVENYISYMFILPESKIGGAILANTNDYLVTNNILEKDIRKNLLLMLTGAAPTEASHYTYLTSHLLIDIGYLLVFLTAVLPLIFLRRYVRRLSVEQKNRAIIAVIALHFALPTALIFAPNIFGVPLWVIRDYVPDLFWVLAISTFLLYTTGGIKAYLLHLIIIEIEKDQKTRKTLDVLQVSHFL